MRLNENRNWFVCLLLTFITLGIYGLYLIHCVAKETNISCKEDGKNTMGLLLYILLSIVTFGIWGIIWTCLVISRWENKASQAKEQPKCTLVSYLLWSILGSLIFVGPIVAYAKMIGGLNQANRLYNSSNKA